MNYIYSPQLHSDEEVSLSHCHKPNRHKASQTDCLKKGGLNILVGVNLKKVMVIFMIMKYLCLYIDSTFNWYLDSRQFI